MIILMYMYACTHIYIQAEKSGILYKQSNDRIHGKSWSKHEFEITDGRITYGKNDVGTIDDAGATTERDNYVTYDLRQCTVEIYTPPVGRVEGATIPVGTCPFRLKGPGPSMDPVWELVLSASDEQERSQWIVFIQKYTT